MKKRILALLLAGLLLLSLAACGKPAATAETAGDALVPELTAEATAAMSTFMNGGMYKIENSMLFGFQQAADGAPGFGSVALGVKDGFPTFESPTGLVPDCTPRYLCSDQDYFFFTDDDTRLLRLDRQTREVKTLYDGACAYLQIVGDRLYFTDKDEKLVSTDRDGKDMDVIFERATRYPYVLPDRILFQDVENNESLHIYFPSDGSAIKLNDEPSYLPTLCGQYLYYTTPVGEKTYRLCRMDLSTEDRPVERGEKDMGQFFAIDGKLLYALNGACWELDHWFDVQDSSPRYGVVNRVYYVSEEYTVAFDYKEDGTIEYKWLTLNSSGGGSYF